MFMEVETVRGFRRNFLMKTRPDSGKICSSWPVLLDEVGERYECTAWRRKTVFCWYEAEDHITDQPFFEKPGGGKHTSRLQMVIRVSRKQESGRVRWCTARWWRDSHTTHAESARKSVIVRSLAEGARVPADSVPASTRPDDGYSSSHKNR